MKKIFTFMACMAFVTGVDAQVTNLGNVDNNANDVGVPSSTRVCDHNMGTTSYKEYGSYYQWGTKESAARCSSSTYGDKYTTITVADISGKGVSPNDYDVAMMYGQPWIKQLTKTMWQEIIDNCKWVWSDDDKVMYVSGASATIVLAAAGYKNDRTTVNGGTDGYYWTSTLNESNTNEAYAVHFNKDGAEIISMDRGYGLSIRPGIPGYIFNEDDEVNACPLGNSNVFASFQTSLDEGDWRLLCAPFLINEESGNVTMDGFVDQIATFQGVEGGVAKFVTDQTNGIYAGIASGVPCLVQLSYGFNGNILGNRNIDDNSSAENNKLTVGDYTLTGVYAKTIVPAGAYAYSDGKFVKSDGTLETKAYTAILTTTATDGPEEIPCSVDDTSLGVRTVLSDTDAPSDVYNIQGMKVKSKAVTGAKGLDGLQKGIYIVNGKKVIK